MTPQQEYTHRLEALKISESRDRKRDYRLAASKLTLGVCFVLLTVWLAKYDPARLLILAAPAVAFVVLVIVHERVLTSRRRHARLIAFYQQGIARLEDRWAGTGQQGERFLQDAHPYARDLDLFGKASLFELLCTARTRAGEETLAAWILAPASFDEIADRQQAIQDLTPRLDFREKLALAGEALRTGVKPDELIAWSTAPLPPHLKMYRLAASLLTALWLFSLFAWWKWDWTAAALTISAVNLALRYKVQQQVSHLAAQIESAAHDLSLLAGILKHIEDEHFAAPRLQQLQSQLRTIGVPPSRAVQRLSRRIQWLESGENWFVRIFDLFALYMPQCVAAIEAWRSVYGAAIPKWLSVAGEVEALTAFSAYAYEHPEDIYPTFVEAGPYFDAEAFAHPLLPISHAVPNDLKLNRELQLLVISGPNMAGKSTFIRSVGVNAVLAQAGAPVRARRMTLSRLQVTASICILDSLQGGLSRFYAEISRLRQIDILSHDPTPVLFLLDELLSGTNSNDRRVGTESFVKSLIARGAIGLVTTHDLALTEIVSHLGTHAENFHFQDTFADGKLHFDYRLTHGIVQTTNALQLMRSIGLEV